MTDTGSKEQGTPSPDPGGRKVACADIQSFLFEYMTHELGEARAVLIREHLRKCRDCQAAAAEIQATLTVLLAASPEGTGIPSRLSEKSRSRLRWALMHPVMNWIVRNHTIVSLLVALAVVIAVFLSLRNHPIWKQDTGRHVGVRVLLTPMDIPSRPDTATPERESLP